VSKEDNVFFNSVELLDKRIAAAEDAARKLQEATRDANSALKAIGEARRALEADRKELVASVDAKVGSLITEVTRAALDDMGKLTQEAMANSVKKVNSEFTRLEKILLGEEPGDTGKSIRDYIKEMEQVFKISYDNLMYALTYAQVSQEEVK
jgi:hypothetical protein